jgi:hypothetical protein
MRHVPTFLSNGQMVMRGTAHLSETMSLLVASQRVCLTGNSGEYRYREQKSQQPDVLVHSVVLREPTRTMRSRDPYG